MRARLLGSFLEQREHAVSFTQVALGVCDRDIAFGVGAALRERDHVIELQLGRANTATANMAAHPIASTDAREIYTFNNGASFQRPPQRLTSTFRR